MAALHYRATTLSSHYIIEPCTTLSTTQFCFVCVCVIAGWASWQHMFALCMGVQQFSARFWGAVWTRFKCETTSPPSLKWAPGLCSKRWPCPFVWLDCWHNWPLVQPFSLPANLLASQPVFVTCIVLVCTTCTICYLYWASWQHKFACVWVCGVCLSLLGSIWQHNFALCVCVSLLGEHHDNTCLLCVWVYSIRFCASAKTRSDYQVLTQCDTHTHTKQNWLSAAQQWWHTPHTHTQAK